MGAEGSEGFGMATEDQYKFAGKEFSAPILRTLVAERWAGKTARRRDMIADCLNYHLSQGGLDEPYPDSALSSAERTARSRRGGTPASQLRARAFRSLRDAGLARQGEAHGEWEIFPVEGMGEAPASNHSPTPSSAGANTLRVDVQREIGEGVESIFVVFFPTFRRCAELSGETRWACLLGATTERVVPAETALVQTATRSPIPELPVIGLIVRCSDSESLATGIHAILRSRGQCSVNPQGQEWCRTSPEEVVELIEMITGASIQPN